MGRDGFREFWEGERKGWVWVAFSGFSQMELSFLFLSPITSEGGLGGFRHFRVISSIVVLASQSREGRSTSLRSRVDPAGWAFILVYFYFS